MHYFVLEDQDGQLKLTSLFLSGDQGHQRLYGYLDRDSLLNKDVQDVLPASLIAKVRCILSGRHEHETDEIHANGNEYWRTQLYPLKKSNDYGQVLSGVVGECLRITSPLKGWTDWDRYRHQHYAREDQGSGSSAS